jgi:tRNA(adenine34) deaminase
VTKWDEAFDLAFTCARQAWQRFGDVPVGAVVLDPADRIIAAGGNDREWSGDPTGHAEIVALRAAAEKLGSWRLDGCTLVATLEPCTMCAGAIVSARLARLVYAADDPKAGAVASLFDVVRDPRLPHRVEVTRGIRAAESQELLQAFFQAQRA